MLEIRLASSVVVLMALALAAAEPFAPKAEPPEGEGPAMALHMLEAAVVPDAAAVGVPAYPGAVVIQTSAAGDLVLHEDDGDCESLATVVLVSPDEPEEVLAFYAEALPEWVHEEDFMVHVLWSDGGGHELFTCSWITTPSVQIREAVGGETTLVPAARSWIQVAYGGS